MAVMMMKHGREERGEEGEEDVLTAVVVEMSAAKGKGRLIMTLEELKSTTRISFTKRDARAVLFGERTLTMATQLYPQGHPEIASASIMLAQILLTLSNNDGLKQQRRAEECDPDVVDDENENDNPGQHDNGQDLGLQKAELLLNEALEILCNDAKGDPLRCADISKVLMTLGMVMERQGLKRHTEVLQAYREALSISQNVFGPHHPDTADANLCLATALRSHVVSEHDFESALRAYQCALDAFRRAYPSNPTHPRVQLCLESMALLNWQAAERLEEEGCFGRAAVLQRAVEMKVGGAPLATGYFFRFVPLLFGLMEQKKDVYAALYPCPPPAVDSTGVTRGEDEEDGDNEEEDEGEDADDDGRRKKLLLIWAFDERNACGRGLQKPDFGGVVELVRPVVEVEVDCSRSGAAGESAALFVTVVSRAGSGVGREVFAGYARDGRVAEAWLEMLGGEEDTEEEEDDETDDGSDTDDDDDDDDDDGDDEKQRLFVGTAE